MKNLGQRIRKSRIQAGFTQESLAETIGVSRTAIAQWERGEKEPKLLHLICMSKIFRVSTDYLLGVEPPDKTLSHEAWEALKILIREVREE